MTKNLSTGAKGKACERPVRGARLRVPGSAFPPRGARSSMSAARRPARGTRGPPPGARRAEPGARRAERGFRRRVPDPGAAFLSPCSVRT